MLFRLVIAFLLRSKLLLISWLQPLSAVILESKKIKSLIVSIISPSICHEVMRPAEKVMTPHSSTLAWKIPWMVEPGRLQSMWPLRIGHDWATSLSLSCIGEGNGNPLQYSCLENPRVRGACWAAVYGGAQSRTRLTRLSSSSSPPILNPLPPPSSPDLSGLFQSTGFGCPASCIKLALIILFYIW